MHLGRSALHRLRFKNSPPLHGELSTGWRRPQAMKLCGAAGQQVHGRVSRHGASRTPFRLMVRCEPRTALDTSSPTAGRRASNHARRKSQTPLGAGRSHSNRRTARSVELPLRCAWFEARPLLDHCVTMRLTRGRARPPFENSLPPHGESKWGNALFSKSRRRWGLRAVHGPSLGSQIAPGNRMGNVSSG